MPTLEVEESKDSSKSWHKPVMLLVGAVVLAGILGGIWQWRVDADKAAYKNAMRQEDLAGLTKDYAGAIANWEKYRHGPWPRNYEYEAELFEASLYLTLHKDQEALAMFRLAEPRIKGNDTAVYDGIAMISERNGDYETAIKYYEKIESIYAKQNIGTAEYEWTHGHIAMLKEKAKNAK